MFWYRNSSISQSTAPFFAILTTTKFTGYKVALAENKTVNNDWFTGAKVIGAFPTRRVILVH